MAAVARSLYEQLGTKHAPSTAYHQQTDGLVERFVHTVMDMVRTCVGRDYDHWDGLLPALLFAYRTARHASTTVTPALALYGRELVTPADALLALLPRDAMPVATADDYDIGQLVLLRRMAKVHKLEPNWAGPFEVEKKIGSLNYVLREPATDKLQTVHVERMKPFHSPYDADLASTAASSTDTGSDTDEDDDTDNKHNQDTEPSSLARSKRTETELGPFGLSAF